MTELEEDTWYVGQLEDGKPNGQGKEYWRRNRRVIYEGEWKDGERHGQGKEYWQRAHCVAYDGEWKNG
jgi:hypothetical protein